MNAYSIGSKRYNLWDSADSSVVTSRDVWFEEDSSYCQRVAVVETSYNVDLKSFIKNEK